MMSCVKLSTLAHQKMNGSKSGMKEKELERKGDRRNLERFIQSKKNFLKVGLVGVSSCK